MGLCIIVARSFNHIHTFHNLSEFINEIWSLLDVIIDYDSSSIPNVLWIIRSLISIMTQAFFDFGIFLLLYCNVPKTTMIKHFFFRPVWLWREFPMTFDMIMVSATTKLKHESYVNIRITLPLGSSLNTSSLGIIKDYRCSIKAYSNTGHQLIGAQIHSDL